jgi:hypothetical protein
MPYRQTHARAVLIGAALLASAVATPVGADTKPKLAVFDFQLANLAQLPPTQADKDRLPRISDLLRKQLADSGRFVIVPVTDKVKQEVAKAAPLRDCGGCAVDFAKELGADVAVTGEVQKVSDLILNINVYIKKVGSTDAETATSVDIRGDNDDSFNHGVKYLVKNNILKE